MLRNILVFFFVIIGFGSIGQDSVLVRDFETWNSISIEKKLADKKLTIGFNQEFRSNNNATHLNRTISELGAEYKIFKNVNIGINYRHTLNHRLNKDNSRSQRINFDLGYKKKFDRLKLSGRLRYQVKNKFRIYQTKNDNPINKIRFKLKGNYNIKNWKLNPYIATEVYYSNESISVNYLEQITETENFWGLEKLRFTIGTSYKTKKMGKFGIYYRVEKEIKSYPKFYYTPATYFIIGLNYSLTI